MNELKKQDQVALASSRCIRIIVDFRVQKEKHKVYFATKHPNSIINIGIARFNSPVFDYYIIRPTLASWLLLFAWEASEVRAVETAFTAIRH
jgi:hypothetical protein